MTAQPRKPTRKTEPCSGRNQHVRSVDDKRYRNCGKHEPTECSRHSRNHRCVRNLRLTVAVGTTIADRPPHRTVQALLRIRLPPWMSGEEASYRIRMQNAWGWNPPLEDPGCPVPRHWSLTATA